RHFRDRRPARGGRPRPGRGPRRHTTHRARRRRDHRTACRASSDPEAPPPLRPHRGRTARSPHRGERPRYRTPLLRTFPLTLGRPRTRPEQSPGPTTPHPRLRLGDRTRSRRTGRRPRRTPLAHPVPPPARPAPDPTKAPAPPPPPPDYASETEPVLGEPVADHDDDNWPTQYADLPLARLERWHVKRGPEEARVDIIDARAAVRAERAELRRVREERDHYHTELQDLRREVARLDRPFLYPDEEVSRTGAGRWPARLFVFLLLLVFLGLGLEAGSRFDTGAMDLFPTTFDR